MVELSILRRSIGIFLLAVIAAGCTRAPAGPRDQGGSGSAAVTTTGAAESATGTSAAEEAGALADGVYPTLIREVDPAKRTVEFDLVQYYTGAEAARAAMEDGKIAEDYYVRNANPKLRTLRVGPTLVVVVMSLPGSTEAGTRISLAELRRYERDKTSVFWLTISHGSIIRIEECEGGGCRSAVGKG